jgi:hypothetical protein
LAGKGKTFTYSGFMAIEQKTIWLIAPSFLYEHT